MRMFKLVLCCAALCSAAMAHSLGGHECVHDKLMKHLGGVDFHEQQMLSHDGSGSDSSARRLQSSGDVFEPIRIAVKTDRITNPASEGNLICRSDADQFLPTIATSSSDRSPCSAADVLTSSKRDFLLNKLLPAAVEWFNATLSVRPVSGNLILNQPLPAGSCYGSGYYYTLTCCADQQPSSYSSPGIPNADFLLDVTARPTSGSTLAWALTCQSNSIARPVSGMANFGPKHMSDDPARWDEQLATAIHEISHALGFSSSKFPYFRKPGTTIAQSSSNILKTYTERGRTVQKLVTPVVQAKVLEHFGCDGSTWPSIGAELEDDGGSGTAGSHLQKRIFANEYMTGSADPVSVYSAVSLAVFEDSGWYKVDFTQAEPLPFGAGEGCDFAYKPCNEWPSTYFCTSSSQVVCSPDMREQLQCRIVNWGVDLPGNSQYLPGKPSYGGPDPFRDYCPLYVSSGQRCDDSGALTSWYYGELVGPSSRCFAGTWRVKLEGSTTLPEHVGCLQTSCDALPGKLQLALSNSNTGHTEYITCPVAGGLVSLPASSEFEGAVECPVYSKVCDGDPCSSLNCNEGSCVSGTCVCKPGWKNSVVGGSTVYCNARSCPTSGGSECGTHGTCNSNTGVCACDSGWTGSACAIQGCAYGLPPLGYEQESACAASEACECAGIGSCVSLECVCPAGTAGSNCAALVAPGQGQCGNGLYGTPQPSTGMCVCLAQDHPTTGQPQHYTGQACELLHNGTRSLPVLQYLGEPIPNSNTTVGGPLQVGRPTLAVLWPREYHWLQFDVKNTQFGVSIKSRVLGRANCTAPAAPATQGNWSSNSSSSVLACTPSLASAGSPTDPRTLPQMAAGYYSGGLGATLPKLGATLWTALPNQGSNGSLTLTMPASPQFKNSGSMALALGTPADDGMGPLVVQINLTRPSCGAVADLCQNTQPGQPVCTAGQCNCARTATPSGSPYGWTGQLCTSPDAPGQPDCSGRGTVVLQHDDSLGMRMPVCQCPGIYTGDACEHFHVPAETVVLGDSASMARPGVAATASAGCADNSTVTPCRVLLDINTTSNGSTVGVPVLLIAQQLHTAYNLAGYLTAVAVLEAVGSPGADPVLLRSQHGLPTATEYTDAAQSSWVQGAGSSMLHWRVAGVDSGVAAASALPLHFVGVQNSKYATAKLQYRLRVEVSDACPLLLGGCSGHGSCLLASNAWQCQCDSGWFGPQCSQREYSPVPNAVTPPIAPGSWVYYRKAIPAGHAEITVTVKATQVSSPLAMPVMVAFENVGNKFPITVLSSERAQFDYDGWQQLRAGNQSAWQVLRILRQRRDAASEVFIGIHNAKSARGTAVMTMNVSSSTSVWTKASCTGPACNAQYCAGRGTYQLATVNGKSEGACNCRVGWDASTYCASTLLRNFKGMLEASQSVKFMCGLCSSQVALSTGQLAVFKVSKPVQQGTGLRLHVMSTATENSTLPSSDNSTSLPSSRILAAGQGSGAQPGLFVAQELPRALFDFGLIKSDGSSSADADVAGGSSSRSSSLYVGVYAHQDGTYTLSAERQAGDAKHVSTPSFWAEFGDWLTGTTAGTAVIVGGALFVAGVLCCCGMQYACAARMSQYDADAHAHNVEYEMAKAHPEMEGGYARGGMGHPSAFTEDAELHEYMVQVNLEQDFAPPPAR